jgi:hypothetical protein
MLQSAIITLTTFVSTSLALVYGVDSSTLVSEATYAQAKSEGFTKAIIRGYEEACGVGGQVDPNFVSSYNNARAAGITNIDAYWLYVNLCRKSMAMQLTYISARAQAQAIHASPMLLKLPKSGLHSWQTQWTLAPFGSISNPTRRFVIMCAS